MCMRLCVHICNQRLQRNDKFLYSKEALRRSDYMLITSWYYDERSQEFKKTSLKELKRLEYDNKEEFLYIKERLYRSQNKSVPMILVRKGLNQGFRRKGNSTGNHTSKSRGECESLTHQGNKEALATVDELIIMFNDEKVKLFIKRVEVEKEIVCNGTTYEIDLFFELEKTEPTVYYDQWNGKLWFEVFHTCKVDSKQAEDFAIANETLFEYKVPNFFNFVNNISLEGYEKRKLFIAEKYRKNGVYGCLISKTRQESLAYWKKSEKGNWTARIGEHSFTIVKSKFGENYGLVYGNGKCLWQYNGKKFLTIDDAKRNADFIAFKLYNGEKI